MTHFNHDGREAYVAAAVAWFGENHEGSNSHSYRDLCRAQRLARKLGLPDYIEPHELDSGLYHWTAADYYRELRAEHGSKGYTDCACRDCSEIAVGAGLCADCEESGCCDLGGADCGRHDTEPDSDIFDKGYQCEYML